MARQTISGIYLISFSNSPRVYIGSSADLFSRTREHQREALRGEHCNPIVQACYTRGVATYRVLEFCATSELLRVEQQYIDQFRLQNIPLCNIATQAGAPMRGRRFSDSGRAKLARRLEGRVFTAEHKAKISAAKKNQPKSPEHRAFMAATLAAYRKSLQV